jgi:hypothetical protein
MWLGYLWSAGPDDYRVDAIPVQSLEEALRKIKTIRLRILTYWVYQFDAGGKHVIHHDYLVGRSVPNVARPGLQAD